MAKIIHLFPGEFHSFNRIVQYFGNQAFSESEIYSVEALPSVYYSSNPN